MNHTNQTIEYVGIIELNDAVLYIERDEHSIYAGGSSNHGSTRQYSHEIDETFSFDENLQEFIDNIDFD